jgi:HEAT repeat protein
MLGAALQVAPATIDRELATELFARVDDNDYRVRLVAIYHLSVASTLNPQVASVALTICSTALADTHHHVRAEAAEQIGTIAANCDTVPGKTVADIERALVNEDPDVQRDAALGLGTLLGETAINEAPHTELLIDHLPDAPTKAQAGIARSLARITARDPDAGELIAHQLLDEIEAGETTVDGLPTAIGAVASDSEEEMQRTIYRRLSELVENGTPPQRVTATRAFVSLSEWHGLHPEILFNRFLSLLDDSNVDVQQAAAAGLQSVSMDAISPSRNNSDRLEGSLQAESWSVRFAAAVQLVAHNPKSVSTPDQVMSALLDGLHQGSLKTRLTAVQRVGDICHHYPSCRTEGIEELAGHLEMVDSLVQREILDVLAGLTNLEPESVRVVTESAINSYRSNPEETSQPLGELLARLYLKELLSPGEKHLQETISSLITDHSVDEPWETILVDMLVQIPAKTSVHDLN